MNTKVSLIVILSSVLSSVSIISLKQSFTNTSWYISFTVCVLFAFFYYYVFQLIKLDRSDVLSFFSQMTISILLLIFSLSLMLSFKGSLAHLQDNSFFTQLFVYFGSYITITVIVFTVTYKLLRLNTVITCNSIPKKQIFLYALPCILIWSMFLIAFFPGGMTPDSFSHWRQIHTLELSNWHPVLYTGFILMLTSIWHSPAVVVIGQSIILALIFGYGMYSLNSYGISTKITWIATVTFAISPLNTGFILMIWKDVLYSASLFLLTVVLLHVVLSNGKWLNKWHHLLLLTIVMLCIMLIRNNGLPIIIVLGICLIASYRFYFKRLLIALISVFALFFLITGPLFDYLDVTPANPNEALGIPTQQIARVLASNGKVTSDQVAYFNQILPIEQWRTLYYPYRTDSIKFAPDYNSEVITSNSSAFFKNWASVVYQNPKLSFDAFLNQTSLVWQINEPRNGYTDIFTTTIYQPNNYELTSQSLSPWLQTQFTRWYNFSQKYMKEIIWRPAVYTFSILLLSFVSSLKIGWRTWLIVLPVLLNTGTIFAGLPAQDFRYLYANTLVIYILLFLAILNKNRSVANE